MITITRRSFWLHSLAVGSLIALAPTVAPAASPKPGEANPVHETVDLLDGIKANQLEVEARFEDATKGKLFIKNKTDKPLNVKLPEVFAGVPALPQFGGPLGAGGGGGGGQGGGIGGGGGGGAAFNIPPEKVRKVDVPFICLEHGKRDPAPTMKYTVAPIEQLTDNVQVHELIKQQAKAGPQYHAVFQAAAWHLANGLSWQQLAAKRVKRIGGFPDRPYFSRAQLVAAKQLTDQVARTTADSRQDRSLAEK